MIRLSMSMSLDGFVAGPDDSVQDGGVTHLRYRVLNDAREDAPAPTS